LVEVVDGNKRGVFRRDLEVNELAKDKEYVAMARSYVGAELKRIDSLSGERGST